MDARTATVQGERRTRPDTQSLRHKQLKQKGQLELSVTIRRKRQGGSWLPDLAVCIHGETGSSTHKGHPRPAMKGGGTPHAKQYRTSALLPRTFCTGDCLAKKAGEKLGKAVTSGAYFTWVPVK